MPVKTRLDVVDSDHCVGCECCMFACARRQGRVSLDASCIGIRSAGGISKGFRVIVCRACEDPPCAKVCPTDALRLRDGGGVVLDAAACIGCGNCREACPIGCVYWDHAQQKPLICIHCGVCVPYCPYGVIALEHGDKVRVGRRGKVVELGPDDSATDVPAVAGDAMGEGDGDAER